MDKSAVKLVMNGELRLREGNRTLANLEEFCKKARELGLGDDAPFQIFRQGVFGPMLGLTFRIPVEPKKGGV